MSAMPKSRVEAFSDGVIAVAITLLVLDLHVSATGDGSLGHQLGQEWPQFVAYLASFTVIGVIWINHHAVFTLAARVDRGVLYYNLLLLMFVTTTPFTTSVVAEFLTTGGADSRWAVLLYAISMQGMSISYLLILHRLISRELLVHPVSAEVGRRALLRFGAGNVIYPVGLLIGLLSPVAMVIAYGLVAAYYAVDQVAILPDVADADEVEA